MNQEGFEPSKRKDQFRLRLTSQRENHIHLLKDLCDIECGSEMVAGVNQVGKLLKDILSNLGLNVISHPAKDFGNHLVASTALSGDQIILGGHIDTTYIDYASLPSFHLDGPYAIGPGTADMKGGVVVFVAALDCLKSAGLLSSIPLTLILNSDEERGAPTSRWLFEKYTKICKAALFSECAGPKGEIVISRRAKISYQLDIKGIGRHAGDKAFDKVSALMELSHKILAIENLNKKFQGSAINVGRAWGGMASNTVAEFATALIDVRYPTSDLESPVRTDMQSICDGSLIPGSQSTLTETSFRPAWERKKTDPTLIQTAQGLGKSLGFSLPVEERGGTADSNWFGSASKPCLDGLGPIGFDDHTPRERIILDSLFDRALLVALLITELGADNTQSEERK